MTGRTSVAPSADINAAATAKPISNIGWRTVATGGLVLRDRQVGVSATPYPMPVNQTVRVLVSAVGASTGAQVNGQVKIGGKVAGNTNQAFKHGPSRSDARWATSGARV